MRSLIVQPDDVKHVLVLVDPHTGNYAVFLATDHELITIPVSARTMPLFSLFYRSGELDYLHHSVHHSGIVAWLEDGTILCVPLKHPPGFPLRTSKPGDFRVAIQDFAQPLELPDIGTVDTVVLLWRPVQPGEITPPMIAHINRAHKVRWREFQDQDPHDQAQRSAQEPDPSPHVTPPGPGIPQPPEPEKPTPPVPKRSVGRTRKFAFIHSRIMELMEPDGLSVRDIEVYRIIYTYRKYPEKTRIRPKGKGPAYPLPYSIIYQAQVIDYLKVRRTDLLATATGPRRNRARQMGTSRSAVQRAIDKLCRFGYLARVYPGRPKDCPWLSPQAQERRDERHWRVPQWGPQKYILATDRCQRDLLKGLNLKLRRLALPPYLIYLPGPRF